MRKKIIGFACIILCFAVMCTVTGAVPHKKTVAVAKNSTFAAGETQGESSILGGVAEAVSGINSVGDGGIINGIIGEIIGDEAVSEGINGIIGGLVDGLSGFSVSGNKNNTTQSATYNIETIAPMVTEAPQETTTPATSAPETTVTESTTYGLTVAEGTDEVPFAKPAAAVPADEESDFVRWAQWIFIYTDYGLRSDGITGKLDEDTVACIKRLQLERGLKVDGELNEDTIEKIESLYLEKKQQGNTSLYAESAVTAETETQVATEQKNENGGKIIMIIAVVSACWIVILGIVITILMLKKKKMQKDVKEPDKKEKGEKKSGGVGDLSDLFEEAEKKSKKKKK